MSTRRKQSSPRQTAFLDVLKHIELQVSILKRAGAKPDVVALWQKVLSHLQSIPPDQIDITLELPSHERKQGQETTASDFSDDDISKLEVGAVEKLLGDDRPRRDLERVARIRFGLTPGDLSNLSNRASLAEKLRSMCDNERTHGAIARAVRKGGS